MSAPIAIAPGTRFEHWTVIERRGSNCHGKALWLCECDCGVRSDIVVGNLIRGLSTCCKKCSSKANICNINKAKAKRYDIGDGVTMTISEMADASGHPVSAIHRRLASMTPWEAAFGEWKKRGQAARVVDIVLRAGAPITVSAVLGTIEAAGELASKSSVFTALADAATAGKICRIKPGLYSAPPPTNKAA